MVSLNYGMWFFTTKHNFSLNYGISTFGIGWSWPPKAADFLLIRLLIHNFYPENASMRLYRKKICRVPLCNYNFHIIMVSLNYGIGGHYGPLSLNYVNIIKWKTSVGPGVVRGVCDHSFKWIARILATLYSDCVQGRSCVCGVKASGEWGRCASVAPALRALLQKPPR